MASVCDEEARRIPPLRATGVPLAACLEFLQF